MLNKKSSAIAALACITTVGLALGISPAKAFDPVAQKYAIVGSDTLEDVVGALVNGTSITGSGVKATTSDSSTFGSFDATGTGTIFTKAYGTRFQRPNGSGDGRTALDALITGAQYTSTFSGRDKTYDKKVTLADGDIDIVRASSGGTVNSNGLDNMQRFSFGRDAIALAYGSGLTWTASGVTKGYIPQADIKAIYQCNGATLTKYGITAAWIPQAGSGTRNDFISKTGVSETQDILANLDAASNLAVNGSSSGPLGAGCIHVGQEHDASTLGATEIMPMSATRWIAMKNGASYDKSGSAELGGFVGATSLPVAGTAPNLTPVVAYYKDSTWGRDTYLFVDRRRTDGSSYTTKPASLVTSGTTDSFVVTSTSNIYAGQAVSGTGIVAGTLVKKVYASGDKFGKGTSGATTLLTSSAPGVDQYISGVGIAANTRVTAVDTFSTKALNFDASASSNTLTLNATGSQTFSTEYAIGQSVVGVGIPKYTYVTAVDSGAKTVTLSANTTVALSNTAITIGDTTRGTATALGTSLTIETANAHIAVGAAVSGTGIATGTVVTDNSGTTVTLSKAVTAAISNGTITFTKNTVTLNNVLTANINAGDAVTFLKTLKLSAATNADLATTADLTFSSPSYDPVLARALDYSYSGSLTYQGGALFGTQARAAQPTTATASNGGTVLTLPTTLGVKMATRVVVGETVSGTGITSGTTVTAVDTTANTVTISAVTTAALTATDVLFGYSYDQMSDVIYPSFSAGSFAAVKLKFGFLPASTQPTNEYAGK